jgi:hypothetical protein
MEPSELHVDTAGFFYDDSRITVPMLLKSAMCLVKILFKRATFRVYTPPVVRRTDKNKQLTIVKPTQNGINHHK